MNRIENFFNVRFGRLTVMGRGNDYIQPNGKHRVRWLCRCDCGKEVSVQPGSLFNGKSRSCGCLQRELARARAASGSNRKADITGDRFGKLVAISPIKTEKGTGVIWLCRCDCGSTIEVPVRSLRSGNTQSCGCLRDEKISNVNKTHGKSNTRLYHVWVGMRQRCNDPNHKSFKNYGGRGIRVCDEWSDYPTFERWALSHGYVEAKQGECTIDRIDVNGHYCPKNCRWVSMSEQAKNKR